MMLVKGEILNFLAKHHGFHNCHIENKHTKFTLKVQTMTRVLRECSSECEPVLLCSTADRMQ